MSNKRGPSVLVTDARERQPARPGIQRQATGQTAPNRMRFISVDNVLQYASEIPSGQPRVPPSQRSPGPSASSMAGRPSGSRMGSLRGLPNLASARTGMQIVPSRTTKISEKLVLLPDNDEAAPDADAEEDDLDPDEASELAAIALEQEAEAPPRDDELERLRRRGGVVRGRTYAERLPKKQRAEKLSRVTAYCTAQSYRVRATAEFLRDKHGAKTKLYDDCLYVVYHLPLLPGADGNRVRSRPILKTPGTGKTVLDLEIERSERRDEHMGYFDEEPARSPDDRNGTVGIEPVDGRQDEHSISPINRLAPDAKTFAEMFVFSYGVVVFWNFTERQEKDILADLTFAGSSSGDEDTTPLITRPLPESDFETEEFHFEYSSRAARPRVFNDMITLLPRSDHMVRLSISHAIAQSTKLCFFEEKMSETMLGAQHVPKRLALTGELSMTRTEIVKILGRLFKSRVDINLSSNILDVPNFFWESEPTLHPLYVAVREYLEIGPRIKVLNERCRVFLDLAEILSDSVADAKMSSITWIIIVLIIVSIVVTVTEVALRFGILQKEKDFRDRPKSGAALELRGVMERANVSLPELRAWGARLTDEERAAVCGGEIVGRTFAGV